MKWISGIVCCLALLAGCASEETVSKRASETRAVARKAHPPKSTTTPYYFIAPYMGEWVWVADSGFRVILRETGQIAYGPYLMGTYKIMGDTIELALNGIPGSPFEGRRVPPILFKVSIFQSEDGPVMVFSQGEAVIVFKRFRP